MGDVDVRRWLWILALGLEEAGLEADDVVTQLVVLGLQSFETFSEAIEFPHLRLQGLDVPFFSLSERAL